MDPKQNDYENPDTIRPIIDGFRYRYRTASYPEKALTILGIFDDIDDGQLYGIVEDLASIKREQSFERDELIIRDTYRTYRIGVRDDIGFPTLTKRRTRDYVVEYILRRCYDYIVGNCLEFGYPLPYLSYVVQAIGGYACIPNMRRSFADDEAIVQVGKLLKAMDIIDRKTDDTRVDEEILRFKRKSKELRTIERESMFNTVFGGVDYNNKVTAEHDRDMWRCYKGLRDVNILPEIPNSKDVVFKVRRGKGWAGRYHSAIKFLVVDSYDSFVHEYAHALDYIMGNLSQRYGFAHILERYRKELDAECSKRDIMCPDPVYYKRPTECFARCFEMYVMMHSGPNILLRSFYPEWAYPEDPILRKDICVYFDGLCGKTA